MLSILPKQIEDESLASYVLRLTLRNGFNSPLDWLDKATFSALAKNSLSYKQKRKLSEFAPISLDSNISNFSARRSVLFQDCHADFPRLCPLCVKGSGYLKEDWSNIGNLACEIHNVALVDCCQQCGEQLEWSVLLLQCSCTNEQCISQLDSPEVNDEITELFIDEICDCLLANLLLATPYTTVLPCYKHPNLRNFNRSVADGFRLLTDRETFNSFANLITAPQSPLKNLPQKYKLFPLTLLEHNLKSKWPISEWLLNISSIEMQNASETGGIRDFTVTVESAVNLLSISKKQLISAIPELSHKKNLPGNSRVNIASLLTKH